MKRLLLTLYIVTLTVITAIAQDIEKMAPPGFDLL